MQNNYEDSSSQQPRSQLLRLADNIIAAGGFVVDDGNVVEVMGRFISFYECSCAAPHYHRQVVADAAAALASQNPIALDMVIDSAIRYAVLMKEIGDASPYSPNSVTILTKLPQSEKIVLVLTQIMNDHPGMAQGDAAAGLRDCSGSFTAALKA